MSYSSRKSSEVMSYEQLLVAIWAAIVNSKRSVVSIRIRHDLYHAVRRKVNNRKLYGYRIQLGQQLTEPFELEFLQHARV